MRWRVGLNVSVCLLMVYSSIGLSANSGNPSVKEIHLNTHQSYQVIRDSASDHATNLHQIIVKKWSITHRQHLVAQLAGSGIRVILVGDNVRVILPADMIFNRQTGEINTLYHKQLQHVVEFVKTYGEPNLHIIGHSDIVATKKQNTIYSKQLAEKIAAYFWANGIPYERLHVKGVGDYHRVSDIHGQLNRRIEVQFKR